MEGGSAAGVEDNRFFEEPEGGVEEVRASQEAAAGGLSVSLVLRVTDFEFLY